MAEIESIGDKYIYIASFLRVLRHLPGSCSGDGALAFPIEAYSITANPKGPACRQNNNNNKNLNKKKIEDEWMPRQLRKMKLIE